LVGTAHEKFSAGNFSENYIFQRMISGEAGCISHRMKFTLASIPWRVGIFPKGEPDLLTLSEK